MWGLLSLITRHALGERETWAQSVETISTLTRRLLPPSGLLLSSQPSATASSPAGLPCTLLKGLSNTTYYSGLLLFPLESGAAPPCPITGVGACQSPQPQRCWKEHIGEAAFTWKYARSITISIPFNPKSAVFQNKMRPGD